MNIIENIADNQVLRVVVDTNEESFFSLLKAYMQDLPEVDLVGVYKEHYLVDKTEFFLKTKKGKALDVFKKSLSKIKKDLESKKVK